MNERFGKLRKRNVYLHHYTEYMDLADIDGAAECIQDLGAEYGRLDIARVPDTVPSIEPLGIR
jgi:tubulin epsilon|tara:strand:+ start:125 stop:313 length:189 start_codon:yes stop_codon:yes gene_type:complete